MVEVELTDEAWAIFEKEAKARNLTVQQLFDQAKGIPRGRLPLKNNCLFV